MSNKLGTDAEVGLWHGFLLGGTYNLVDGIPSSDDINDPLASPGLSPGVTHTITFKKGGEGLDGFDADKVTVPASYSVNDGSPLYPRTQPGAEYDFNPETEDGYIFDGWSPSDNILSVNNDVVLTATWSKHTVTRYTLTFDANGGELNLPDGVTSGMKFIKGSDITSYIINSSAAKTNTNFAGWLGSDGVLYTSESGGPIIITDDLTLTAQYTNITYTVRYNAGEGTGTDYITENVTVGTEITLITLEKAGFTAPEGKKFEAWKSSVDGEPNYQPGGSYTVNSDVIFTAEWVSESRAVTVQFYDTWNDETTTGGTISTDGTTVSFAQVEDMAPSYWSQARIGGLIGQNNDVGTATHCYVYYTGVGGYGMVGGLVGANFGTCENLLTARYKGVYNGSTTYVSRWIGTALDAGTNTAILYEASSNTTISAENAIYGRVASSLKGTNITYMTSSFGNTYWSYADSDYPTLNSWSKVNGTTDYFNN